MGACLELADLAPDNLAPALADALADQALQDALDIEAGRVGRRGHRSAGLADRKAVVDRKPQPDVVHGVLGLLQAAMTVMPCIRLCVDQPCLDLPEAVVTEIAEAFDRAAVHQAARLAVGIGIGW